MRCVVDLLNRDGRYEEISEHRATSKATKERGWATRFPRKVRGYSAKELTKEVDNETTPTEAQGEEEKKIREENKVGSV